MTWETIFKKVIVALDEAESNTLQQNMADYKNEIYECADSCQREISAFAKEIIKYKKIKVENKRADLPDDCYEAICLFDEDDNRVSFTDLGDGRIKTEDGSYVLKYYAYSERFDENTALQEKPQISEEAQEAMVYGICAGLCINDEPELYSTYMQRYNGLIDSMITRKNNMVRATVVGGMRM